MLLNKQEKILLSVFLVLIIVPVFYFKAFVPFTRKWAGQTGEIRKKQAVIKKNEAIIAEKDELLEEFSSLSEKVQAKLSLERGESSFLSEIGKVAWDNNIHIVTMNPLPFKDLGAFEELSVEIDMEANLGNFVRFLYQMRKSSVVLVANRLRLQPKSERSALLRGHLVISTIFLKEKG